LPYQYNPVFSCKPSTQIQAHLNRIEDEPLGVHVGSRGSVAAVGFPRAALVPIGDRKVSFVRSEQIEKGGHRLPGSAVQEKDRRGAGTQALDANPLVQSTNTNEPAGIAAARAAAESIFNQQGHTSHGSDRVST
jgi:hypothetical protein